MKANYQTSAQFIKYKNVNLIGPNHYKRLELRDQYQYQRGGKAKEKQLQIPVGILKLVLFCLKLFYTTVMMYYPIHRI